MAGHANGIYYAPLFFHILPYSELQSIVNGAKIGGYFLPLWTTAGPVGTPYQYLRMTPVPIYKCPTDYTMGKAVANDWLPGDSSYASNWNVFGNRSAPTSAALNDWDGKAKLNTVFNDGQSGTIMFTEKLAWCTGPQASHDHGGTWWLRGIYHNASGSGPGGSGDSYPGDRLSGVFGGGRGNDGTQWVTGPASKFLVRPRNPISRTNGDCNNQVASTSHHGIHICMGDASVRFLAPQVSNNTWWALTTSNGGDQPGEDGQ